MDTNKYDGLELSTALLIDAALQREVDVEILDKDDNFIRLKKDNKIEYIKQATKTSADSYIAPLIMENKEVTKIILREKQLNVPKGIKIKSISEAMENIHRFKGRDIVVKPKSTNFGLGISIIKGLPSKNDYRKAVENAFKYGDSILIEDFITGNEYRFLVIGNEVTAILHRIPANVIGDGVQTIEELVAEKNENPLRGLGYVTPLEKIRLEHTEIDFLKIHKKTIHDIPEKGETVFLRENSNISTGGDSIDYTDEIIEDYKQIAVRSAAAVGAKICGADIIIKDVHQKPDEHNYCIIELNFNPALHIHNYPYQGQNRHVEEKVLDLLGF